MELNEPRYHLDINGLISGPLTGKELAWKIAAASPDDVIRFRPEGSTEWLPAEKYPLKNGAQQDPEPASSALPTPPKLRLKKRAENFAPSDVPPPPPNGPTDYAGGSETPPPPPGAPFGGPLVEVPIYTDDNPPPPPGAIAPPPPPGGIKLAPPAPPQASPPPPPASQALPTPTPPPPARLTTLLVSSFIITLGIALYILVFMKQDVSGLARCSPGTGPAKAVKGMRYSVIKADEAESWKAARLAELTSFAAKAKTEATACSGRIDPLTEGVQELALKYDVGSHALLFLGAGARSLGIKYETESIADRRTLRSVEAALEIAAPYLKPSTRADLEKGNFTQVSISARNDGFPSLSRAFEMEASAIEAKLETALSAVRPTAQSAIGFVNRTLYSLTTETPCAASGSTDELGQFNSQLAPGDYYLIAGDASPEGSRPYGWAIRFTVRPFAENVVNLDDDNLAGGSPQSLWRPVETAGAERDIEILGRQFERASKSTLKIKEIRRTIESRKSELDRPSGN